jgi:fucose 4-O-acetylase-like acetyltransferase
MFERVNDLSYNNWFFSGIYLFAMPLFIFVSGFFSKRFEDRKCFLMGEFRLFETFVMLHLISIFYKLLVEGCPIGKSDIINPGFSSWYLVSLIYFRAILQFTPKGFLNSKWLIPACLAISLLGGFVPVGRAFSIQRTFTFLPFFMLGYLVKERNLLEIIRIKPWMAVSILVLVFVGLFVSISLIDEWGYQFHCVMTGRYTYYETSNYTLHPLPYRAIFLILSAITSCVVLSLVPTKRVPILTDNGKDSLLFYFYHSIVFRLALMLYPVLSLETNTLNVVLGAVVVMAILMLFNKIPFLHYIMNPVTRKLKPNTK